MMPQSNAVTEVTYVGTVYPLESVTVVAADDFDFKKLGFQEQRRHDDKAVKLHSGVKRLYHIF